MMRAPNAAELKAKAKVTEWMENDRQRLLMRQPFIGSVAMHLELVAVCDSRLQTAATDGDSVYVDIRFFSNLSMEERLFVLAHEVWHCVLLHLIRRQNRDAHDFNYAADLEIHFVLEQEKMAEPFVLPHDPDWAGLSAEEIYEKLKRRAKKNPKSKAGKVKLAGKGVQEGAQSANIKSRGGGGFDEHPWDEEPGDEPGGGDGMVLDPDFQPGVRAGAAERLRAAAIQAALHIERTRGVLPGHIAGIVERLHQPQIRWQELLAQFVTKCYGARRQWLPPARRHVWKKMYLPGLYEHRLRAVVALDTSGSTIPNLPLFFGELTSLLRTFGNYELVVIQCDAEVQHVEKFDAAHPLPQDRKWHSFGHGGTDFRPVFTHVAKQAGFQPDLLIYFTDGYGPAPERPPPYPVMWLLADGGTFPAPWGMKVFFDPTPKRRGLG